MTPEQRWDQRDLSDFGRYFLNQLPTELADIQSTIDDATERKRGLIGLRQVLDTEALAKGELTGDPRLDAAICLGTSLTDHWIEASTAVYRRMLDEQDRLKGWQGGFMLYDGTTQSSHPYCGHLVFGRVEKPQLKVIFKPGFQHLDSKPSILIQEYYPLEEFSITDHFQDEAEGSLDVSKLFHPNWGTENGLRWEVLGSGHKDGLAGLFLGEAEIRDHFQKVKDFLYGSETNPQNREFILSVDRFLAKN